MGIASHIIVCPDGKVRHYPYTNEDDALADAEAIDRERCPLTCKDGTDSGLGPCPGRGHAVRGGPQIELGGLEE